MCENLLENLRHALNHLYDPDVMCTNPLVDLLGLSQRFNPGLALQQVIIQAIESMEPPDKLPDHSHPSRGYEVLLHRYIQQWPQKEVAESLGISERQVRREQQAALTMLAQQLANSYSIGRRLAAQRNAAQRTRADAVDRELRWLHDTPPPEAPASLSEALQSALSMASSLVTKHGVRLRVDTAPSLPGLSIHPLALRQVLLTLLNSIICRHCRGELRISAHAINGGAELSLQAPGMVIDRNLREEEGDFSVIHKLVKALNGRLSLTQGEALSVTLLFPAASQVPVLVVDDNKDTLQLFERYVMGTRYRMITTSTPEDVLALAMGVSPTIVILDIMMPAIDGLELLTRFVQHPATDGIPIVVCSILPNRELAIALGASAFLEKPFTREGLLRTLDGLMPPLALESY